MITNFEKNQNILKKTEKKAKILIVEDSTIVAKNIQQRVEKLGYDVPFVVPSGEEAVTKAGEARPDVVLMDIHLEGRMDGIEAAEQIRLLYDIPIVYLTAYADPETLQRAKITEPYGYIIKPFEERELQSNIEIALYKHSMEEQLRSNEEKYRLIFESFQDAYYRSDMFGKFVEISPSIYSLLGYKPEELLDHPVTEVYLFPEERKILIQKLIESGEVNDYEIKLRHKNGSTVYGSASSHFIRDKNGNPLGVEGVVRNISERKKIEQELREKTTDLETMNQHFEETQQELIQLNKSLEQKINERTWEIQRLLEQKNEFINQLGHDLKNPLTPILGFLKLIQKKEQNPELKEMLTVVQTNANYMKKLVEQILNLAHLNSPNIHFEIGCFNLAELVDEVILENKLLVSEKQLTLRKTVENSLWVESDKLRIKEVFNNIISNAVKYTPEQGSIDIKACCEDNFVVLSISDTGIGMTPNQISHAFEEFYKADTSRHAFDSTGLGLSICKRIIERQQGSIWIESPGARKGSTIHFTLKKSKK